MAYEVLARKYRPNQFSELVGQDAVVRTLSNAIKLDRLANAYLFSGSRGIGKTSIARILSKAMNCLSRKNGESEPCGTCDNCIAITQGSHLDVLEIDGASNRGIDQIRDLRDNVQFAPAASKYKIYIIDEVHMLTPEAFNALLKTLEEPPAHVKFMFATTEAHRLPNTILSRCQRFDLNKISSPAIIGHLEKISKAEKIEIDPKVFDLITKVSDGALRDAESILDQLAIFSEGKITLEDAYQTLGSVSDDFFAELITAVRLGDFKPCIALIDQVDQKGKDFNLLILDWLDYLRKLLLIRHMEQPQEDFNLSEAAFSKMQAMNQNISEANLLDWIDLINEAHSKLRFSPQKRIIFESTVLRSIRLFKLTSIDEIIASLPGGNTDHPQAFEPGKEDLLEQVPSGADNVQKEVNSSSANGTWQDVLEYVGKKKPLARAILNETTCKFDSGFYKIQLQKDNAFNIEALKQKENQSLIESAIQSVFGKNAKFVYEISGEEPQDLKPTKDSQEVIKSWDGRVQNNSVVQKALEIFQGHIEDVN